MSNLLHNFSAVYSSDHIVVRHFFAFEGKHISGFSFFRELIAKRLKDGVRWIQSCMTEPTSTFLLHFS